MESFELQALLYMYKTYDMLNRQILLKVVKSILVSGFMKKQNSTVSHINVFSIVALRVSPSIGMLYTDMMGADDLFLFDI